MKFIDESNRFRRKMKNQIARCRFSELEPIKGYDLKLRYIPQIDHIPFLKYMRELHIIRGS
jgi:hypothetical protein